MKLLRKIVSRVYRDIQTNRTALIILSVYGVITQVLFGTVCPFAIVTGLPCPACGLTRAGVLLLTAHFAEAWEKNASIFLWVPFLLILIFYRYVRGKKPPFLLPLTIAVCLLTLFYYVYRIAAGICVTVPTSGLLHLVFSQTEWYNSTGFINIIP